MTALRFSSLLITIRHKFIRGFSTTKEPTGLFPVLRELRERNIIYQTTLVDGAAEKIEKPIVYAGFDPTAPSLHIGHLFTLMGLVHFQRLGFQTIAVVGGGTGQVGDPSLRTKSRGDIEVNSIAENTTSLIKQLEAFNVATKSYLEYLQDDNVDNFKDMLILDNNQWLGSISIVDFLRDIGRHGRVSKLLEKERSQNPDDGLTYTELSYQMIQGFDFYYLQKKYGCNLQLGGSDQLGNIQTGVSLIRKIQDDSEYPVYGITTPLLTLNGAKIGKSIGNAIWLDQSLTNCFEFYQYFLKRNDVEVLSMLKYFTLIEHDDLREIAEEHQDCPENMTAQKILAEHVTRLVHGPEAFEKAKLITDILFSKKKSENLRASEVIHAFKGVNMLHKMTSKEWMKATLPQLLINTLICENEDEALAAINNGSVYFNYEKVSKALKLDKLPLIDDQVAVLRLGKSKFSVVQIEN